MRSSRIPKFNELSIDERIEYVGEFSSLRYAEKQLLYDSFAVISKKYAGALIENCICGNPLIGVVTNARINDKDYLIPLSLEEPSVIAAGSRAFRLARENHIEAKSLGNHMKGQVQITGLDDIKETELLLRENEQDILKLANKGHRYTQAESIGFEQLDDELLLYLIVDTGDIQGANTINNMCESVAGYLEEVTGGEVIARIISNYADRCMVKGCMRIAKDDLERGGFSGDDALQRFLKVSGLAEKNIDRAVTNNKGIMNGIIGIANATGQDTRAIEAAAHSHASRDGRYTSLGRWYEDDQYLVGELEMPMPVGIIKGATGHPYHKLALKILGADSAREFQEVLVSVGLASNFSAMHEIATKGITEGHMRLHRKRFG